MANRLLVCLVLLCLVTNNTVSGKGGGRSSGSSRGWGSRSSSRHSGSSSWFGSSSSRSSSAHKYPTSSSGLSGSGGGWVPWSLPSLSGASSRSNSGPKINYPPSTGLSGSGYTNSKYPPSSGLSGSASSKYPPSTGLSGSGSYIYPPSFGLSGSGTNNYPSSSGLSGTSSGKYPPSNGLSGSGSIGNKYPFNGISGGPIGNQYPPSTGLSGTGHYPPSTGLSGSGINSYPPYNGLSGSGSKIPSRQYYPGVSNTIKPEHINSYKPSSTYHTNTGYGRGSSSSGSFYAPPTYYTAPQHVYITEYRNSDSRYGDLLTGLALYNMGRSHSHYHDHYYYDDYYHRRYNNGGGSYYRSNEKPKDEAQCSLRIKENGKIEMLKIPCEIVSTFTEGSKKISPTNTTTSTVCVTNYTIINNTNPAPSVLQTLPSNVTISNTTSTSFSNNTNSLHNLIIDNTNVTNNNSLYNFTIPKTEDNLLLPNITYSTSNNSTKINASLLNLPNVSDLVFNNFSLSKLNGINFNLNNTFNVTMPHTADSIVNDSLLILPRPNITNFSPSSFILNNNILNMSYPASNITNSSVDSSSITFMEDSVLTTTISSFTTGIPSSATSMVAPRETVTIPTILTLSNNSNSIPNIRIVNSTSCTYSTDPLAVKGPPINMYDMECDVEIVTKDSHFRNRIDCSTLIEYAKMPEPKKDSGILPSRSKLKSWLSNPPWWLSMFIAL